MGDDPLIARVVEKAQSNLFVLEEVEVKFGRRCTKTFERLRERRPHAVLMVSIDDARRVLLVREFVAGLGRRELRLPTGRVESAERSEDAARRELREELGLDSRLQQVIYRIHNEPGHSDAYTDVVVLTGLTPSPLSGDEPEALEQVPWPLDRLRELLRHAKITDSRTIAALFLAGAYLGSDLNRPGWFSEEPSSGSENETS